MCLLFNTFFILEKSGEVLIWVRGNPDFSLNAMLLAPLGYQSTIDKNAFDRGIVRTVVKVKS